MAPVTTPPEEYAGAALLERLRSTTAFLEHIVANRLVLADVPDEDRRRLMKAVMMVRSPDSRTRRRLEKAVARNERAARTQRDEDVLEETGIRALRRKPVVTTPNVFPPKQFEPHDRHGDEPATAAPAAAAPERSPA
jgi:hypothetical protein